MKSWMKVLLLILAGVLALGAGAFGAWYFLEKQNEQEMEEIERQAREAVKEEQTVEKEKIRIGELSFARISDREIEIRWPDQWDGYIREYQIERRTPETGSWEQVGSLPAGQGTEEGQLSWVDTLEDSYPGWGILHRMGVDTDANMGDIPANFLALTADTADQQALAVPVVGGEVERRLLAADPSRTFAPAHRPPPSAEATRPPPSPSRRRARGDAPRRR